MGIQNKIDEIRQKPEHIRLRWAWSMAIIFTFFVVIVWIFSFKTQNKEIENPGFSESQKDLLDEFGQQKKSLQDAAGDMKNVLNNQTQSGQ